MIDLLKGLEFLKGHPGWVNTFIFLLMAIALAKLARWYLRKHVEALAHHEVVLKKQEKAIDRVTAILVGPDGDNGIRGTVRRHSERIGVTEKEIVALKTKLENQ